MKTLEKTHPTPTQNLEENPLPDLTPELQAMADEMAAATALLKPALSLEAAQAQVPEELRPRSTSAASLCVQGKRVSPSE